MTSKKTRPEEILSEFPKKYQDFLPKEINISGYRQCNGDCLRLSKFIFIVEMIAVPFLFR